jgi:hypothetical protein
VRSYADVRNFMQSLERHSGGDAALRSTSTGLSRRSRFNGFHSTLPMSLSLTRSRKAHVSRSLLFHIATPT